MYLIVHGHPDALPSAVACENPHTILSIAIYDVVLRSGRRKDRSHGPDITCEPGAPQGCLTPAHDHKRPPTAKRRNARWKEHRFQDCGNGSDANGEIQRRGLEQAGTKGWASPIFVSSLPGRRGSWPCAPTPTRGNPGSTLMVRRVHHERAALRTARWEGKCCPSVQID